MDAMGFWAQQEPSHGVPGEYQSEGKGAAAVFAGWAPNG